MWDDQVIFEIFEMRPRTQWPSVDDVFTVEDDIQVNCSWPVSERWDPPNTSFNPLENLEENNW